MRAFFAQLENDDELILAGPSARHLAVELPSIRRFETDDSLLVPELWREGLVKTDAKIVGFSTTQMVPCAGWLETLVEALAGSTAVGVGGCILPAAHLRWLDRAVYLQRFASYGVREKLPTRPSGENCLYRRSGLMLLQKQVLKSGATGCASALPSSTASKSTGTASGTRVFRDDERRLGFENGFWEVEVQEAIESQAGENRILWQSVPDAIVRFQGRTRLFSFLHQRVQHAARFGANRSRRWRPLWRMAALVFAPLIPGVLLIRAFRHLSAARERMTRWLPAVPHFLAIAAAWTLGEASGILRRADVGKRMIESNV